MRRQGSVSIVCGFVGLLLISWLSLSVVKRWVMVRVCVLWLYVVWCSSSVRVHVCVSASVKLCVLDLRWL